MKTCIIDAGGGMKGCWGAGIVDYLIDNHISFDMAIGVSAGSSNLITLKSRQKGRLLPFYEDYPNRKEYMGPYQKFRNGSFINVKYIFEDLSLPGGENPIDIPVIEKSDMEFYAVATDAQTGRAEYIKTDTFIPLVHEASCNIPIMNRPVKYDGRLWYDGGISDPIPWRKAFELGADKVVVVLTRPEALPRDPKKDEKLSHLLEKKFPNAAKALATRGTVYNNELSDMAELRKEGKILVLSPKDTLGVTTTKHKAKNVRALYAYAYKEAEKIKDFLMGAQND